MLLLIAALAGFGGSNFDGSMSNITYFYPAAQKGWALGLNAAGGNLGASVAQFVVPIVITVGAAATLNLPPAGLIWVPLILVAMIGAYFRMDNLSTAEADITASLATLKEPPLWILATRYIGTFGSFIGFAGVFPKLLADTFPDFKGIAIGTATVTLASLGALVCSLARPYGGKLADRFGGTSITIGSFTVMGLGILGVILTLPLQNFAVFLLCFLVEFAAAGIVNGSTYRMIPTSFALRSDNGIGAERKAAAALGLIWAIGAYDGLHHPAADGPTFDSYAPALGWPLEPPREGMPA